MNDLAFSCASMAQAADHAADSPQQVLDLVLAKDGGRGGGVPLDAGFGGASALTTKVRAFQMS